MFVCFPLWAKAGVGGEVAKFSSLAGLFVAEDSLN